MRLESQNPCLGQQFLEQIWLKSISSLPSEIILKIISSLNLAAQGSVCCLNKEWTLLANDPLLWKISIYRELAFNNDKWAACCGKDALHNEDNEEEFSSLPLSILQEYRKFQNEFPEKNAKESLMLVRLPKTLNGQLTLTNLGNLAKKHFPKNKSGYKTIWSAISEEIGDKSIEKSRWVLMTRDVFPESRDKSFAKQQEILSRLAQKGLLGYEIPQTLEAATCVLAQYFSTKTRLFNGAPLTFIRCQENIGGLQTIIGGFAETGLHVQQHLNGDDNCIGIAPLIRL